MPPPDDRSHASQDVARAITAGFDRRSFHNEYLFWRPGVDAQNGRAS